MLNAWVGSNLDGKLLVGLAELPRDPGKLTELVWCSGCFGMGWLVSDLRAVKTNPCLMQAWGAHPVLCMF